jgi:hypothetical protein
MDALKAQHGLNFLLEFCAVLQTYLLYATQIKFDCTRLVGLYDSR